MKASQQHRDYSGPTPERIIQSDGHVVIGDDQQGTRVYHMLDSVLDRTYSALMRGAASYDENILAREYAALKRFQRHFEEGGMLGTVGSIDPNRSGGDSSRSFLAKSEAQLHARDEVYRAKGTLSHWQWVVVSNVVLNDHPLEIAGYAIGCRSKTRAFEKARVVLRGAGESLSVMWDMR